MNITLEFTEPLLGTLPADPDIAREFILANHPTGVPAADEDATLPAADDVFEKSITTFARVDGKPIVWDYQIKGFFKDACLAMIDMQSHTQDSLKKAGLTKYMYKRTIDNVIFPRPRFIALEQPDGPPEWPNWESLPEGPMGLKLLQRPLRKENPRGGTTCLATSEIIPPGTKLQCEICIGADRLEPYVVEWLDYGALKGLGQWRNASYGRFAWSARA